MASLTQRTKDLILGLFGGFPTNQQEVINGLQGGLNSLQSLNSLSPVNGNLNIVAGSGISVTPSGSSITIANMEAGGSVTSVAMSVPSFLSVSGSPITTSGTLAVSYSGTALPIANGGTNNSGLAVTAGGVVYTDGSKLVNVGAGTTGYYLQSNGASAPSWTAVSVGPTSQQQSISSGGTINSNTSYNQISPAMGSLTVLTEQTVGGSTNSQSSSINTWMGESFQVSSASTVSQITVYLSIPSGQPTISGTAEILIYNDSGGSPNVEITNGQSTNTFPLSSLVPGASPTTVNFTFSGVSPLTASTTYYFFITVSGGSNIGSSILSAENTGSGYLSGNYWYSLNDGSTFNSNLPHVLQFIVSGPGAAISTSSSVAITAGSNIGQTLVVQDVGSNAIYIKNAATTQLVGGADVLLSPKDTIDLIWDGTYWTQTGGSVNS